MQKKDVIFNFFNSQIHAVLGTVNEKCRPEGATIGFGHTKDLQIIFGTDKRTRKAGNIRANNYISLTFNGPEVTVQYEGKARLISGSDLIKYKKILFTKIPGLEKYARLPNQIYYIVDPLWLRHTDHSTQPGNIFEITF